MPLSISIQSSRRLRRAREIFPRLPVAISLAALQSRVTCIAATAAALTQDPQLTKFGGRVSDSGEGRWTIKASIDEAVPTPVLTSALYSRFSSRGQADFSNKILSAMRYAFGGHLEKPEK